jgi:hypothetical protein
MVNVEFLVLKKGGNQQRMKNALLPSPASSSPSVEILWRMERLWRTRTFWNDGVASTLMEKPPHEMTTLKGLDQSPRMPFNGYNPFRVEGNLATITRGSPLSRGNRWAERWNRLRSSHQHTHMAHACGAGIQGFPRPFKAIKRYPSLFKGFKKVFFYFCGEGRPLGSGRRESPKPVQGPSPGMRGRSPLRNFKTL